MSNKALVEIVIPASGDIFDVYIPFDSRMSEVLSLVSALLSELSKGRFKASSDSVLCDARTGEVLNINMFVAELGIHTGSRLMLI